MLPLLLLPLLLLPVARAQDVDPLAATRNASWDAYWNGDLEAARTLANELLSQDQDDAWSHLLLGKIEEDSGAWGDEHLDRAEQLGSDDVAIVASLADTWAVRYAGLLYTSSEAMAPASRFAAERLYRRWQELAPQSALPLQGRARLRQAAGDVEGAIGLLHAAIAKNPDELPPHNDLWAHLGSNLTYERLAAFYEGLAQGNHAPLTRARCRQFGGEVHAAKAETMLRAVADADTAAPDTAQRVTDLQEAKDQFLLAIEAMRDSIAIDAGFAPRADWNIAHYEVGIGAVYRHLGDLAALLNHVDATRPLLAEVLSANPDAAEPKTLIGLLSTHVFLVVGGEQGQRGDAEERARWRRAMDALCDYWHWACTLDERSAEWWNNAAFFAREAGRYEESYAAYRKCAALDPENVRFLNDAAVIPLYYLERDFDTAESLLRKAFELGAQQYPASVGDALAEADMRSAWGDSMLNLGLLYILTGRYDQAHAALQQLTEFDPDRPDLQQMKRRLDAARGAR